MRVINRFQPRDLVANMLESLTEWKALTQFALTVIDAKEEAERKRQSLKGIASLHR